jgi:adsorption protein B
MAVLVPAWDESGVIASMLRAALDRFDYPNYSIFVGYYRNDPATAAIPASAIAASKPCRSRPMARPPRPIA